MKYAVLPSSINRLNRLPEFAGITEWINIPAEKRDFSLQDLQNNVVLVYFWSYTSAASLRALPHLTDWYKTYGGSSLVIVGIHTPQFVFEKNIGEVAAQIKKLQIEYAVGIDNEYLLWNAYGNKIRPSFYLADVRGMVRYMSPGEGRWDETEESIQALLNEAERKIKSSSGTVLDATPQLYPLPDIFLGSERINDFLVGRNLREGRYELTETAEVPTGMVSLGGNWAVNSEGATAGEKASLTCRFHAANVYLVLRPGKGSAEVDVFLDGKVADEENSGTDAKGGIIKAGHDGIYHVLSSIDPRTSRLLRLEFPNAGTEIYEIEFG